MKRAEGNIKSTPFSAEGRTKYFTTQRVSKRLHITEDQLDVAAESSHRISLATNWIVDQVELVITEYFKQSYGLYILEVCIQPSTKKSFSFNEIPDKKVNMNTKLFKSHVGQVDEKLSHYKRIQTYLLIKRFYFDQDDYFGLGLNIRFTQTWNKTDD